MSHRFEYHKYVGPTVPGILDKPFWMISIDGHVVGHPIMSEAQALIITNWCKTVLDEELED